MYCDMLGHRFSKYAPPPQDGKSDFEKLLKVFMQLLLITSGNVAEALQWLTEVDKQYGLTGKDYGIGDFIEDLKKNGYITDEGPEQSLAATKLHTMAVVMSQQPTGVIMNLVTR